MPSALAERRDFSGEEESAPATSSEWSSMRAARRWTAPMKAPSPPPTMPYLILPSALSLLPVIAIVVPLCDPEGAAIGLLIDARCCEVVEGLLGHADDVIGDELRALACAV